MWLFCMQKESEDGGGNSLETFWKTILYCSFTRQHLFPLVWRVVTHHVSLHWWCVLEYDSTSEDSKVGSHYQEQMSVNIVTVMRPSPHQCSTFSGIISASQGLVIDTSRLFQEAHSLIKGGTRHARLPMKWVDLYNLSLGPNKPKYFFGSLCSTAITWASSCSALWNIFSLWGPGQVWGSPYINHEGLGTCCCWCQGVAACC